MHIENKMGNISPLCCLKYLMSRKKGNIKPFVPVVYAKVKKPLFIINGGPYQHWNLNYFAFPFSDSLICLL